jgi:hypothetical protein
MALCALDQRSQTCAAGSETGNRPGAVDTIQLLPDELVRSKEALSIRSTEYSERALGVTVFKDDARLERFMASSELRTKKLKNRVMIRLRCR